MSVLNFDIDHRSLLKRTDSHQFIREDLTQFHPDRVIHAIECIEDVFLQPFGAERARFNKLGQRARLFMHERKDWKSLFERLILSQKSFDDA